MEVLQQFDYATIICDGCACRIDSQVNDERLQDCTTLIEDYLPYEGWEPQDEAEEKWLCPECVKDETRRKHRGEGRVIVEPITLSGIRCDLCGRQFENYDGYSWWEDFRDTEGFAKDGGVEGDRR